MSDDGQQGTTTSTMRLMSLVGVVYFLAKHTLLESRLILVLLIGAVAAGTGFQIPNAANMLGYKAELIEEGVSSWFGDIRVRPTEGTSFEDSDDIVRKLKGYSSVKAVLPLLTMPGAVGKGNQLSGGLVIATPMGESAHPFRRIEGELLTPGDHEGVLLGSSIARRLGVGAGDRVKLRIVLQSGLAAFPEDAVLRYSMVVRGVVGGSFGAHEAIFVDRDFLAEEAGTPKAASVVVVHLHNHVNEAAIAAQMSADLPETLVRAWMDDSAYLRSAVLANEAVGGVSQAMVVAAVTIPVLALLYINVLYRRREVGVLSAIGFGQAEIFAVFLLQALLVGLLGIGVGWGIGYGLVRYFQAHPIFEWEGFVIRPVLSFECFIKPSVVVLGATLVAGVYPAWRASRLDPAPVLRGID